MMPLPPSSQIRRNPFFFSPAHIRRGLFFLFVPLLLAGPGEPVTASAQIASGQVLDYGLRASLSAGGSGSKPYAGLLRGMDGNLYGTTSSGGPTNGAVFEFGADNAFIVLHSFSAVDGNGVNSDGSSPADALIQDADGNFYGTATLGGAHAAGTVFEITTDGDFVTLHSFDPANGEGSKPNGALVLGSDGALRGTTLGGGAHDNGTVFRLVPGGPITTLHSFGATNSSDVNADGAAPYGALTEDSATGDFYGDTFGGGAFGYGTIFKLTKSGTFTVAATFGTSSDTAGARPIAGLTGDSVHGFYGLAAHGPDLFGFVYKFTPATAAIAVLHSFSNSSTEGSNPNGTPLMGSDGDLYGTTVEGGANGMGTLFRLRPDGTGFATLYSFGAATGDAINPYDQLAEIGAGTFVGTTLLGGANNNGAIFSFSMAPLITSAMTARANVGSPFSYRIVAGDSPTSYSVQGLSDGLEFNADTGVISGTPLATGAPLLIISATNSVGSTSQSLTVTVAGPVPAITSAAAATGKTGTAFSYRITASGNPTSFGATGLPAGLSVNAATGVISGTPTAAGTSQVTLTATNSNGTGSGVLMLTVTVGPPRITSSLSATATQGAAFNYRITATNSPTKYGESGLPAGLTINQTTGVISGAPAVPGTYTVTIAAFNATGSGSATLTLTVNGAPPKITSSVTASATVAQAFTYQITATNNPIKYGASGLPAGLAINQTTGAITGKPTKAGTYSATIAAFNATGSGSAKLTLTLH